MNAEILKIAAKARRLSQSDLARLAGVSRQAVSAWLKAPGGMANTEMKSIQKLSAALGLTADDLIQKIPILNDPERKASLQVSVNWDKQFPDLETYLVALVYWDPRAVARWVQRFGLFAAAASLGQSVWDRFPDYSKYIQPVRRRDCQKIWELQKNLGLI